MADIDALRALVTARAGGACEYCRLLQDASGVRFHVDHIKPRSLGGATNLANLALSCPGCNLAKGPRQIGMDLNGFERELFNPRMYEPWILGWHLHFSLDLITGRIVPRSDVGEATIAVLAMNGPARSFARKLQVEAGLLR